MSNVGSGIEAKLSQVNMNLDRIATCMEAFLAAHEEAKNQDVTVLMKDAMDAFCDANPTMGAAMKAMEHQLLRGQKNAISGS